MAAKKPIIASDIPVLKEVLRNNYNAILCDPSSVDEWVHALEHLSQDTALREKIANTAYHDFKSHYTWDRRVEKVLSGLKI